MRRVPSAKADPRDSNSGGRDRGPSASSAASSLEQAQRALAHSADSLMLLSADGTVLYANHTLPGLKQGALEGASIFDSLPTGWASTLRECLGRVLQTRRTSSFEVELNGTTDGRVAVEGRLAPIDTEGRVDQVVLTAFDVTERKGIEGELSLDAKRFRFLTDTISDVIWTMDRLQRITYVSPSIERLVGYTANEMQSMELGQILAPESYALARESLLEELRLETGPELETSRTRTLDLKLLRKDGSTIWCEAKMSFLRDAGGRTNGVLGVARDISSWREAQEALAASEERLRRAQRLEAVGQLAGGIAHDFNNLLTVILGNVELMLKELPTEELLYSQAREINKAADRAASLTRQLLAFSRKQMMVPEVLNLNSVVEEMARMLRGLLGESIELELELYPALDKVKADPSQIELVLVNLAINARDAMPEGGKLVIETGNARLDPKHGSGEFTVVEGPYVRLAVTDSGRGIDPQHLAKIFEPFFTTKQVGKGTGLGLSTVYGIVKQSGGYIWVDSRTGHGARFEIYLPRVERGGATRSSLRPRPDRAAGTETVLLVEDEESVRSLTRRILEAQGYRVLEARGADLALEVIDDADQSIDLLLTDIIMPGLSGTQLAKHAARRRPGLKVLYISGHSDEMLSPHRRDTDRVRLVHKPFSPAVLAAAVRRVLDAPAGRPGIGRDRGSAATSE